MMKKSYYQPEINILNVVVDSNVLEISEIPIVDEQYYGEFDVKDVNTVSEEDFDVTNLF